ncbi:MAG: DUF4301 domain-containing protein [Deltaproteobacteria bacterium HGW-Deltaproteobacteria-12]|jgi:hypothetical protein|nr:MAG: DUF4301 domain-containing protein [Deltaproteobacteria bacterium HGW-Deltaproteobacteria-12]
MKKFIFTPKDIREIKASGMHPADVEKQLALYRRGSNYLKLHRPCVLKDGIVSLSPAQRKKLIDIYDRESDRYKLIKFVPASGAASRMFTEWFSAIGKGGFGSGDLDRKFFRDLKKFPFYSRISENNTGAEFLAKKDIKGLLEFILGSNGLNYGNLPKALIPFHRYAAGESRTALEEHLREATGYICGGGVSSLHFTISAEHKQAIAKYLQKLIAQHGGTGGGKYKVALSLQSVSTNMIAAAENNLPLRDAAGELVFRPGGHGALLDNLNNLDADFIFIRNIDNIVPELLSEKNLPFRKMLGGMALQISQMNFAFLRSLAAEADYPEIDKIVAHCSQTLNIVFPQSFAGMSKKKKSQILFSLLNRPLRICGMVKNIGEPGGGPFWVVEKDATQTLQIVEGGQVDKSDPQQAAIWAQSRYFNPVDMVCCIKDYQGDKFILDNYVDKNAYLITTKNEKGVKFNALEMPGLWNGSMAYWNTMFVELPLKVFNPVKTVYDLLRPQHRTTS